MKTTTTTAKELGLALIGRSVKYPCEIAVRMRNAGRQLLESEDGGSLLVVYFILEDACQYASIPDPRLTVARVRWLDQALKTVRSL